MAKILLVNAPPRTSAQEPIVVPPLGLAYLAASARQVGHAVEMLDAFAEQLSWDAFAKRLGGQHYDIIGLSGMTPVLDIIQKAAGICRAHATALILGGPHASVFRETAFAHIPELDYAVFGEGEVTFLELAAALDAGRSGDGLPGIATREGCGPQRERITDLDSIPFPARDLLPNHRYRYPLTGGRVMTTLVSSRGCPYDCVFCDKSVFGCQWRCRSPENVLAEVDEVVARHGVQSIIFYDDLFTLKKDRLVAICEGLIRRQYPLSWKAEGRVDLADGEVLSLMKRAGCDALAYGVETANQHGLDWIGKKTVPDMARAAFDATRRAGIKTIGYFILGIPVETIADARRTIQFAIDLKTDYAQFSILSPLPGSRLHREAVAKGWYREIGAKSVCDKDLLRPVCIAGEWTEEALDTIVREAHRRFYLRPAYIWQALRSAGAPSSWRALAGMGWRMLRYVSRRGN